MLRTATVAAPGPCPTPSKGTIVASEHRAEAVDGAQARVDALADRLARVERFNGWLRVLLVAVLAALLWLASTGLARTHAASASTGAEATGLALRDQAGNLRLVARMHSGAPVVQVLDAGGEARLSFGLRLDETPFIVLSDGDGESRAVLDLDDRSTPALRLVGEDGENAVRIKG